MSDKGENSLFPTWTLLFLLGVIVTVIAILKRPESSVSQLNDEVYTVLEQWQSENDRLLKTITEFKTDIQDSIDKLDDRLTRLEQQIDEGESIVLPSASTLRQRYADIIEMARSGRSIADIAKETGKGNGEIELILQLASRGDADD